MRTIVSEVFRKPVLLNLKAALSADNEVHWIGGNAAICGFDHKLTTPIGYGDEGRFSGNTCVPYELASGGIPGCWSSDSVYSGGASDEAGVPVPDISNQTGFYGGPWEAVGMSQAEFMSWIGPRTDPPPANPVGAVYLDNDGVAQNVSGSWGMGGGTGEGFLYVDGDLNLGSSFVYKGIIYIEGDLSFSGHACGPSSGGGSPGAWRTRPVWPAPASTSVTICWRRTSASEPTSSRLRRTRPSCAT